MSTDSKASAGIKHTGGVKKKEKEKGKEKGTELHWVLKDKQTDLDCEMNLHHSLTDRLFGSQKAVYLAASKKKKEKKRGEIIREVL